MKKLWKRLNGHKTQIGATALLLVGFAINRGWLQQDTADLLLGLLTLWTGMAITHAEIKKKRLHGEPSQPAP